MNYVVVIMFFLFFSIFLFNSLKKAGDTCIQEFILFIYFLMFSHLQSVYLGISKGHDSKTIWHWKLLLTARYCSLCLCLKWFVFKKCEIPETIHCFPDACIKLFLILTFDLCLSIVSFFMSFYTHFLRC